MLGACYRFYNVCGFLRCLTYSSTAFSPSGGAPSFIARLTSCCASLSSPIAVLATARLPRASEFWGSSSSVRLKLMIACSNIPMLRYAVPRLNWIFGSFGSSHAASSKSCAALSGSPICADLSPRVKYSSAVVG